MSPSLYVSVLGDSLERNTNATKILKPTLTDEEAVTLSVANAFTAIIDDILAVYGASQLVYTDDTRLVNTSTQYSAVQIGKNLYIYLTTAFHLTYKSVRFATSIQIYYKYVRERKISHNFELNNIIDRNNNIN